MQRGWTKWRARAAAAAAVVACVAAAGCSGSGPLVSQAVPSGTPASMTAGAGQATPGQLASGSPAVAGAPATGSPAAACVTETLGRLSLAQRVGQLFVVGVDGDVAGSALTAAERLDHFGSLLLTKTAIGSAQLAARTAAMQKLAATATGGVGFFIAANQEGGQIQQLAGPGFATMPSAVTQGTWSATALRQAAAGWGTDLRAAGVNLDLAPVMDVVPPGTAATNAPIGQLDREFGSDPAANGTHGTAFIQGMSQAGVMSVAKHFPGLGRVAGNTDFTSDVTDNVTTASDPDLGSFKAAIGAGVPMVMVALATYTKIDSRELAVFSPTVMQLLRAQLGFAGVIVSDDLGDAAAVRAMSPGNRAIGFLAAGGDLITSQSLAPAEQMASAMLAKAQGDATFRATVDGAARQVLTAKQAAGLLPC